MSLKPKARQAKPAATPNVVIVGANFAGLSAAAKLARAGRTIDVTLVDPSQSFNWTPNIHEIVSGLKTPRSVELATAQLASRMGHNFIAQRALRIDSAARQVTLEQGHTLHYDALLLASGQVNAGMKTPGVAKHSLGFRRADQAQQVQQRVSARLARGEAMRISIVGGGFSGLEVLGELLRRYRDNAGLEVNVIDAAPQLLAGMPESIGVDIQQHCADLPVNFYLNASIASVDPKAVRLDSGERLPSDLVLWCVGTTVPAWLGESGLPVSRAGIAVRDTLQCEGIDELFAAGDIAAFTPALKKQASYAMDMGMLAAKNITRYLQGDELRIFKPADKPMLLAFGDINTYLILKGEVYASPLLAPLKEAVYQFYMAQFAATLPAARQGWGIVRRYVESVRGLLLPELLQFRFAEVLGRSRKL